MTEELNIDVLETRLSELPVRNPFNFDTNKYSYYMDTAFGWLKVGDKYTADGLTFVPFAKNFKQISSLHLEPTDLYVFAEFIGSRYMSNATNKDKTLAYAAVDSEGNIEIVSISNISYIVDRVVNIDKESPEVKLGLSFKFESSVNKIYYGADDAKMSRGFRADNEAIKIIDADRITKAYIAMLTDADLKTWFDYFNATYFKSKLPASTRITWGNTTFSYTNCYFIDGDDELSTIDGLKVSEVEIVLSRFFVLRYPELFSEIFLHQMIHAWGIPDTHGFLFNRETARLNSMNRKLAIRNEDEYIGKLEDKWHVLAKQGTIPVRSDEEKCGLYCACGGRITSTLTGKYFCNSCQRIINFKAGALE